MKAILLSIKPKYVAKILNSEKTIEVRKKFPKDYKGWVHIYCTKGKPYVKDCRNSLEAVGVSISKMHPAFQIEKDTKYLAKEYLEIAPLINGKVVARFYCDKVEEIKPNISPCDNEINTFLIDSKIDVLEATCLTEYEMEKYLCPNYDGDSPLEYLNKVVGYAIHISQLEIFDKPRELNEFKHYVKPKRTKDDIEFEKKMGCKTFYVSKLKPLTKAPQSYMFIEVEE